MVSVSITLAEQQTLIGLLGNLVCALPWPQPLRAFLEHHQLRYDPGRDTNIIENT